MAAKQATAMSMASLLLFVPKMVLQNQNFDTDLLFKERMCI